MGDVKVIDYPPVCAKCATVRQLTRTAPLSPGYELKHFYCPKCNNELQMAIKKTSGTWQFSASGTGDNAS